MQLVLNFFMFLLAIFSFSNKSLSLTDYQIKRFCAKEKRVSLCIKNLQEKRSDLQKGKAIEKVKIAANAAHPIWKIIKFKSLI